jgi:L-lactate utilization protein LutB
MPIPGSLAPLYAVTEQARSDSPATGEAFLWESEGNAGLSQVLAQKHAKTTPLGKLSDIIGDASPLIRHRPAPAQL